MKLFYIIFIGIEKNFEKAKKVFQKNGIHQHSDSKS